MDEFMKFLNSRGFKGCPVCGNSHSFAWAHTADLPGIGHATMDVHLPGAATIPGAVDGKTQNFDMPLVVLICDNCTHVMIFSKIFYEMRRGLGGEDAAE